MNLDLFAPQSPHTRETICNGAILLRGFALSVDGELLQHIAIIAAQVPPSQLHTPSGLPMSVRTTSCGAASWISDHHGYRYVKRNLQNGWPAIPPSFLRLAQAAAQAAGYEHYVPDSCLINYYTPGAKMNLHQDKNEKDFSPPIVSVSLGVPATFILGGRMRADKTQKIALNHGDVLVWGGQARLYYHGVLPVKKAFYPQLGEQRINLTFRKAL